MSPKINPMPEKDPAYEFANPYVRGLANDILDVLLIARNESPTSERMTALANYIAKRYESRILGPWETKVPVEDRMGR